MRAQRYIKVAAFVLAELMLASILVICCSATSISHSLGKILGIVIPCLSAQIIYLGRATDGKLLDKLLKQGYSQISKPH